MKKAQRELDLNDPKHPCYDAADKFLTVAENEKQLKNEKKTAMQDLIDEMHKHKTSTMTVRGRMMKLKHNPGKETVKIE